jgi:hypothetical protein
MSEFVPGLPMEKLLIWSIFEFANNLKDDKFHADHRKILREAKTIGDQFYSSPFLKKRIKRNIRTVAVQIAGAVDASVHSEQGKVINCDFEAG